MHIRNPTPLAVDILPCHLPDGSACRVAVMKATLDWSGHVAPAGDRIGVFNSDRIETSGPGYPIVRFEADDVPFKPRVDVIVNGTAVAPGGHPVDVFDASVVVGRRAPAVLRVYGPRVWRRMLGVVNTIVCNGTVTKLPLHYGFAYGGADPHDVARVYAPNPAGTGFCVGSPPDGWPLPQLEWLDDGIASVHDRPAPAGFGFYGRAWHPRLAHHGSYTSSELRAAPGWLTRMPRTFSAAAWNAAHPRMICDAAEIEPGSTIRLENIGPAPHMEFTVPGMQIELTLIRGRERNRVRLAFDTLVLEPDTHRVVMVWPHGWRIGVGQPVVDAVEVAI